MWEIVQSRCKNLDSDLCSYVTAVIHHKADTEDWKLFIVKNWREVQGMEDEAEGIAEVKIEERSRRPTVLKSPKVSTVSKTVNIVSHQD